MPKHQKYLHTYPRPTHPVAPGATAKLPKYTILTPSLPPPADPTPPSLPTRPALPDPPEGWISSSHIIPAAYPRQWTDSFGCLSREEGPHAGPSSIPVDESKEARSKRTLGYAKDQLRRRVTARAKDWDEVKKEDWPKPLYLAAERWVRRDRSSGESRREGVTLVMLHANGFHKELWHPTIRKLLSKGLFNPSSQFGAHAGQHPHRSHSEGMEIDEIWLLDDVHHAASMDLNAGRIGALHGWIDGGRDLVNFIDHILPSSMDQSLPSTGVLPWNGEGSGRKVVAVGHSVGGNAVYVSNCQGAKGRVQAAHARPDLFQAIILVESMTTFRSVQNQDAHDLDANNINDWPLLVSTLRRRAVWPSLEVHAKSVRDSGFFKTWRDDVFSAWLTHGIVPHPNGGVQLATPPWAEAVVFAEINALRQAYTKLPELKMPVGFIMSGDATMMSGEEDVRDMVWRPLKAKNERIMSAGHLVPQEKPEELADAIWRYLGSILPALQHGSQARAKL